MSFEDSQAFSFLKASFRYVTEFFLESFGIMSSVMHLTWKSWSWKKSESHRRR